MKYFNIKYNTKNESVECCNNIYNINLNTNFNTNFNEYNIVLLENLFSKDTINFVYYNGHSNDLKFLELIYPIKIVNNPITQSSSLNKL